MDLRPSPEQTQLVDAFAGLYRKQCGYDAVVAAEPTGFDPRLWAGVQALGAVDMAAGGEYGASLLDLSLVAEQHGRHLAPTPMLEAQVVARLLATVGGDVADGALSALLDDGVLTTIAVRPAGDGVAQLVPAGAIASRAVVLDGDELKLMAVTENATPLGNMGCLPLADVAVDAGAPVLVAGPRALTSFATAVDEWRVLVASALHGLAARALEIAVAYVKERHAFGRPIGSFQGVSHRLADRAAEIDGCELLVREAAWAADAYPLRAPELAAMALGFAADTARDTTHYAVHFHGGYGFMVEYAAQAYFRRARSWAAVLENPATSYELVAQRRALRTPGKVPG